MINLILLPALALYAITIMAALFGQAIVIRSLGLGIVSLLSIVIGSLVFWRLMDVWYVIPTAMLLFCMGIGLIFGYGIKSVVPARTRILLISGGSLIAVFPCMAFLLFTFPFRMEDELKEQVKSPDGAYTATLYYKDGLSFGFQHVTIDAAGWHLFGGQGDIVEVACGGIEGISWEGNRTLVVDYDGTKHKDELADIYFVTQERHWRDVQIIYHEVITTDSPPTSTPK